MGASKHQNGGGKALQEARQATAHTTGKHAHAEGVFNADVADVLAYKRSDEKGYEAVRRVLFAKRNSSRNGTLLSVKLR